jgi:hypothetical protein
MKTAPTLTDIYNQVLLSEGKKDKEVAKPVKKDIVVTKKQSIGDAELVGDGPEKVKLPQKVTPLKQKKTKPMESYNSFEKLFKSTINEEDELTSKKPETDSSTSLDFEVPTSNEEAVDEIESTEDEVSDLVSDLQGVVDKLNDILNKISEEAEEETEEENSEVSPEEEFNYEEGEEEKGEEDQKNVKAVESVETHGTPLVNLKSGKDLETKKKYVVASKLKVKKGTAHTGKFTEEPEPKKLTGSEKELCKNTKVKTSNIKPGDFFK